jgi:hypothetical protein
MGGNFFGGNSRRLLRQTSRVKAVKQNRDPKVTKLKAFAGPDLEPFWAEIWGNLRNQMLILAVDRAIQGNGQCVGRCGKAAENNSNLDQSGSYQYGG